MSDQQPQVAPGDEDPPEQGSESLRTFGNAWLVIGVIGLVLLFIAYLITDSPGVGVAVPILLVFLMLGGMWHVQGRRHRG
ncbi:hypothetical protein GA707_12420 [Nostocoides sp. F2B08]|uniref:hypothetical protein n=1 Tax=Nostocoides sp. F2B08 TaxID=2653936 RepID=UPI0012635611|nr:hypothetical protein [Tetrasphaera sp. F2B08]KAB7744239.1 hypothetical protein GA707_12420 [Tetrasphaera sp. F2B08]